MAWITIREARKRVNDAVSDSLLYRLAKQGKLIATQFGGRILIDEDSLADFIAKGSIRVLRMHVKGGKYTVRG